MTTNAKDPVDTLYRWRPTANPCDDPYTRRIDPAFPLLNDTLTRKQRGAEAASTLRDVLLYERYSMDYKTT